MKILEKAGRSAVNYGRYQTLYNIPFHCNTESSIKELESPVFEGTVLVCDDSSTCLQLICEHLRKLGLKVIIARNGKQCVEFVRRRAEIVAENKINSTGNGIKKQIELIFMDIHMPVMCGVEASALIKEIDSDIPIAAFTTDDTYRKRELHISRGIDYYLGKPIRTHELWWCLMKCFIPQNV